MSDLIDRDKAIDVLDDFQSDIENCVTDAYAIARRRMTAIQSARQQGMTKEIHDINTRALDFVVELIDYIFDYPNDDYMTMECLCRKLFKHGLVDKKDGYYLVADGIKADRKTEPTHDLRTETHECVKDTHDKTEPTICDFCRYYNSNIPCGSTPSACKEADKFAEEFVNGLKDLRIIEADRKTESNSEKPNNYEPKTCDNCKLKGSTKWCDNQVVCRAYQPKDEPTISKMEQVDEDMNVRSKDKPQTEDEILREQCRAFMGIVEQTGRE